MLRQMQAIKRLMTGLCVLALLLFAGISGSNIGAPAHLRTPAYSSAIAVAQLSAGQNDGLPCPDHGRDHGLACCGSATCLTGLATLAASPALFDRQPRATYMMVPQLSPSGADRAPGLHPPCLSV